MVRDPNPFQWSALPLDIKIWLALLAGIVAALALGLVVLVTLGLMVLTGMTR